MGSSRRETGRIFAEGGRSSARPGPITDEDAFRQALAHVSTPGMQAPVRRLRGWTAGRRVRPPAAAIEAQVRQALSMPQAASETLAAAAQSASLETDTDLFHSLPVDMDLETGELD